MLITYSKQQPGEPWVSGIMAAPGTDPVSFETAATAQDFTEYLGSANASWYLCRQVAGGSLKVRAGRGAARWLQGRRMEGAAPLHAAAGVARCYAPAAPAAATDASWLCCQHWCWGAGGCTCLM